MCVCVCVCVARYQAGLHKRPLVSRRAGHLESARTPQHTVQRPTIAQVLPGRNSLTLQLLGGNTIDLVSGSRYFNTKLLNTLCIHIYFTFLRLSHPDQITQSQARIKVIGING